MLRLHLSCGQGVPTPFGRCICIDFAQVCSFVGTMGTTTKTHGQIKTTKTSKRIILRLWNAHVTFTLQPRWPHLFWQLYW